MIGSIEFGLTMALYGVAAVFSILISLIIICEALKRRFKRRRSGLPPHEPALLGEVVLSDEEEAAVSAAVMAYVAGLPQAPQGLGSTFKRAQPGRWGVAGRMELMDRRIRG